MTAIFEEIRQLDAARKRGEISPEAFAAAKARLLNSVEEAKVLSQPAAVRRRPAPPPASGLWGMLAMGLLGAGVLTVLAGQLIGDLTIALTLAVTVLAAIVVRAFRGLEG
ncbi:SHOCT domain-containing protein [Cribrihabitans neustonicus]|uniref:SHOCT domain-containing protein n=1 Tax=Cribrihabitans neustonicus TaxID=1429085 RepID=UPI003B5BA69A